MDAAGSTVIADNPAIDAAMGNKYDRIMKRIFQCGKEQGMVLDDTRMIPETISHISPCYYFMRQNTSICSQSHICAGPIFQYNEVE